MKPSDRPDGETYEMYLQAVAKCGFCGKICRKEEPECCDLARGLTVEQVTALAKLREERDRLNMRISDIACIACEELSPTMRRVAARIPLSEARTTEPADARTTRAEGK